MASVEKIAGTTRGNTESSAAIPIAIWLGTFTLAGVLFTPTPLLALLSGVVSILIALVLWRPGRFSILLVPVLVQFIAVTLKPLTAMLTNSSLQELSEFNANLQPAAFFGLVGIATFAFGLRISSGLPPAMVEDLTNWSFKRVTNLAIVAVLCGHALEFVAGRLGGAGQIVLAFSGIKSAGLFVLAYTTLKQRRRRGLLCFVIGIEIAFGMTGFFANALRDIVLVLACSLLCQSRKLRLGAVVSISGVAFFSLALAVFWTSGKSEYREFLNEGTGAQVVLVPLSERLEFLVDKVSNFDSKQFAEGFEKLLERISYIDFLAATIDRVPEYIPHENGALLGTAIWHILTPRILFPDKPAVVSDTVITAYFTGAENAIFATEDTSISIGYLGELYIDFGFVGALLIVFLMAAAYGRCFRAIRDYSGSPQFLNYGLCVMIALPLAIFETALIKLVGSVVMVLLAAFVLQRVVWRFIYPANRFNRGNVSGYGTSP